MSPGFRNILVVFIAGTIAIIFLYKYLSVEEKDKAQISTENASVLSQTDSYNNVNSKRQNIANSIALSSINARLEKLETNLQEETDSRESRPNSIEYAEEYSKQFEELRQQEIDRIFKEDNHDYEWEDSIVNSISQNIQNGRFAGSKIASSECRSNVCKIMFSHNDTKSQEVLRDRIIGGGLEFEELIGTPRSKNGIGTEIVIVRKGHNIISEAEKRASATLAQN